MRLIQDLNRGFTLIEIVLVIVITSIIAASVSIFMYKPIVSYFSMVTRAEMVDQADNALRIYSREIHNALPNSVRVSADGLKLEFIPTITGARYRTAINVVGDDILSFNSIDTAFDVFGNPSTSALNKWMVVYNLGTGITGSDAYASNTTALQQASSNRRQITAATTSKWTISSLAAIPDINQVAPYRIFAVDQPILYVCDLTAKTLSRWSTYGFSSSIPTTLSGTQNVMATDVTGCSFSYDSNVVSQRAGLALIRLELTKKTGNDTEKIVLTGSSHVNNAP